MSETVPTRYNVLHRVPVERTRIDTISDEQEELYDLAVTQSYARMFGDSGQLVQGVRNQELPNILNWVEDKNNTMMLVQLQEDAVVENHLRTIMLPAGVRLAFGIYYRMKPDERRYWSRFVLSGVYVPLTYRELDDDTVSFTQVGWDCTDHFNKNLWRPVGRSPREFQRGHCADRLPLARLQYGRWDFGNARKRRFSSLQQFALYATGTLLQHIANLDGYDGSTHAPAKWVAYDPRLLEGSWTPQFGVATPAILPVKCRRCGEETDRAHWTANNRLCPTCKAAEGTRETFECITCHETIITGDDLDRRHRLGGLECSQCANIHWTREDRNDLIRRLARAATR